MKFSVSPVVRRAVSPVNAAQLKKFTDGLKRLEKTDPCLRVIFNENTSEMILAGAGELHIEIALGELGDILGEDVPFNVFPPVVSYCESVLGKSSVVCLGKSPNKHNRLYFTAEPIGEELVVAIEKGLVDPKDKAFQKILTDQFHWDKATAGRLWFFYGTNCFIDQTHSVSYLPEIRDSIRAAFEWVCKTSALCEEPLRGVRFNLEDAVLHSDTIHRGMGQILPTAHRALFAAFLAADPCIVEPVYLTEIQTETEVVGRIHSVMAQRRGSIVEQLPRLGTPLCVLRGNLPVMESFGFTELIRQATSGRAFPQMIFDHWQVLGDMRDETGLATETVLAVRKRKHLKPNLPTFEEYNDKL